MLPPADALDALDALDSAPPDPALLEDVDGPPAAPLEAWLVGPPDALEIDALDAVPVAPPCPAHSAVVEGLLTHSPNSLQ